MHLISLTHVFTCPRTCGMHIIPLSKSSAHKGVSSIGSKSRCLWSCISKLSTWRPFSQSAPNNIAAACPDLPCKRQAQARSARRDCVLMSCDWNTYKEAGEMHGCLRSIHS
eukprot:6483345-Amphidinium_carterae.1